MEDWVVWKKAPSTKEEMQEDAKLKRSGNASFKKEENGHSSQGEGLVGKG
jgi:hypothetical protein